jgi:GNAT superfamily N-acetyltransferase
MPDLLVNLINLPAQPSLSKQGVIVRSAQPWELSAVRSFIIEHFSTAWADEVQVGFANKPITVFVAISERKLVGFSAYECTRRAFFGPTGVLESARGRGIGTALLIAALSGLKEMGYAYGIIGGVGPVSFYEKTVGAIMIPGSDPGIYRDSLKS